MNIYLEGSLSFRRVLSNSWNLGASTKVTVNIIKFMPQDWCACLIFNHISEMLFTLQTVLHSKSKTLGGHEVRIWISILEISFLTLVWALGIVAYLFISNH